MASDKGEERCGPAARACSLGLAIFLIGGVLGLIVFLTDGGGAIVDVITGSSPSSAPDAQPSAAQLLDPACSGERASRTGAQCELCKAGFWGPNCTACPPCGTHGACDGSGTTSGTGACACAPGWATSSGSAQQCDACALGYYGPDCTPCPACSDHGTCADSGTHGTDGSCVCFSSNDTSTGRTKSFAGADCGACAPGHFGPNCISCTVDCGDHGICADGMQGDGSCRCNPGFMGDACESCAPGVGWAPASDTHCKLGPGLKDLGDGNYTACSGHGTLNTTTGQCVCDDETWTGPGCETKVCDQANKQGELCQTCDCNNNGICDGAGTTQGTGMCRCMGNFAGVSCRACKPGFTGEFCNITCPINDGNSKVCSGHGSCKNDGLAIRGGGICECAAGYSGNKCENGDSTSCNTNTTANPVDCAGRGTCNTTSYTCTCNVAGWDPDSLCQNVLSGWVKIKSPLAEVAKQCPGGAANPCNGNGVCSDSSNTEESCTCNAGFSGKACDKCAYGYFGNATEGRCYECPGGGAASPCNGRGTCHAKTGRCECVSGWDDSSNCTECAAGFWGDRCYSCPRRVAIDVSSDVRILSTSSRICSGNGTCSDGLTGTGECSCSTNFWGQACSSCKHGHFGPNCQACPAAPDGAVCSNLGICSGDGSQQGSGKCLCFPRFAGDKCDKCIAGHHGPACSQCPGLTASGNPCSGHGTCDGAGTRVAGKGSCTCSKGWRGTDCSQKVPCSDLDECSGNGDCVLNTCYCHNGWAGADCKTKVIEPNVCQPACKGLDEKCINRQCQSVAPPSDPCSTVSCTDGQGMCASGICVCNPGFEGSTCGIAMTTAFLWEVKKPWSVCSQTCGDQPGLRERTVGCWDATNRRDAASSKCPSPQPLPDEECRHFACNSMIAVGGLQLLLPFHNVNASVLHQDAFESALTTEIATAAGMAPSTKSVHIISSKSGLDGLATLVRVEIHPGDASVTVDAAVDTLTDQARNPDSKMRTQGSFLRRVIDREGALNFVKVRAVASATGAGSASGAASGPGFEVDTVDPFINLIVQREAATPSANSGGGGGPMSHGGIAGIAVASSFLGLAVIVAGAWYIMHRTKAGSRYKQARRESKGTSMKIQLTEAEKAEMGMHSNPAHAQSKTNAKVQEGVQMIKAAVAQDEARNFTGAINLYQGAVDRFMIAMKFERNATFKFELAKKCDRYLVRIKQLKEYTANHPGGGGGSVGGGSNVAQAPSIAKRSPSLVRAPVV